MLFFPYRVDLDLPRFPILTIIITILCIVIFVAQQKSYEEDAIFATEFCEQKHEKIFFYSIRNIVGSKEPQICAELLLGIHFSQDPHETIDKLATEAKPFNSLNKEQSKRRIKETLDKKYSEFESKLPPSLTASLMYYPNTYNIMDMLSSAFAHADWFHLIGNLIFFFAFAASIEMALGYVLFPLSIIILAIGTNLTYTLTINPETALPTLGLSGVVMGMIGLFTYLMPTARIKCFFWFLIIFKFFAIPAWILAVWYVGWDIYNMTNSGNQSNINFVAHISGAAIGYIFGFLLLRKEKADIQQKLTSK